MQIELSRTVAARPPTVFSTVAHIEDWPQIVRSVLRVDVLTPGPIREGARLLQTRIMLGQWVTHELEVETFERPRRLRLVGDHRGIRYELDHLIDSLHDGCRLMLIFRSRPEGSSGRALQDFITPYMEINLRDELDEDLADLAAAAALTPARRRRHKAGIANSV